MTAVASGNGNARQAALVEWRARQAEGVKLTGAELAQRFGRSPSWGRSVAAEARQSGAPGTAPAAPSAPEASRPADDVLQEEPERGHHPEAAPAAPTVSSAPVGEVPTWVGLLTVAAVLLVTVAAAVASVDHLAEVARLAGTAGWKVWLLPASVDGLATAAALTLYRAHKSGQSAGAWPWLALVVGVAASVAGNIIAVHPDLAATDTLKVAVGATPPLSLALALHLVLGQVGARLPTSEGRWP